MKLQDGLLYFIVYGPGYWESLLLREPSGTWIIVDGCRADGRSPAADLLVEHGATDCTERAHCQDS